MNDYTGDDYDREGCSVAIYVHPAGIFMQVYPPVGKGEGPIEVYSAQSADGIAVALLDWLNGLAPRRGYRDFRFGEST